MTDPPYVMPSWEDATPVNTVTTTSTAPLACQECGHEMRLHAGGVGDRCAGEFYAGGKVCKVCVG